VNNSLTRTSLDVGVTIANTYTIEGLLGKGGMGSVFLASHARLPGKRVAIKVLHTEVTNDEVLARFRREAEIASKLGHPNIVTVHDFNALDDGSPYLVLEYLVGEPLDERMKRGPMPLETVLVIARQVGSALAAAHREGIVHRDLKPQNIFLVATEIEGRVAEIAKVLDFGISKIRGSETVKTQENTMLGTPQYMSPEQATGRQNDVDGRADQFALAVIVHEMITGQPAFPGTSIPEVVFKVVYEEPVSLASVAPTTPAHVIDAVAHAMRKVFTERFATIDEFVQLLTGEALPAKRAMKTSISPPVGSTLADAMAMTMDSANHGAVASALNIPSAVPALTAVAPEIGPAAVAIVVATKSKRLLPMIVAAVVVAAIAAITMLVLARNKTSSSNVALIADAAPVVSIDARPDAVVVASIEDAALTQQSVDAPAKKTPIVKVPTATEKPLVPVVSAPDNAEFAQMLLNAKTALDNGNLMVAVQNANRIIDSITSDSPPSARQRNRAFAIRALAACKNNDLQGAKANFRALFGAAKAEVIKECSANGIELRN
jgi:eukaryotic-like serine/threonine-protein kinase